MFTDVRICVDGGANFGGTALICSYIDSMGKFYLGITEDKQSEMRFTEFMNDFFDSEYKDFSKFIYTDYRCGLLHQFFPKKGAGVIRGKDNREYHLKLHKDTEIIPINLTVFYEDFQLAVKKYYEKLKIDAKLQDNFFKVYESMNSETSANYQELLGKTSYTYVYGPHSSTISAGIIINKQEKK